MAIEKLSDEMLDDVLDKDSYDDGDEASGQQQDKQQQQPPAGDLTAASGARFRAPGEPIPSSEDSNDIYGD